MCVQSCVSMCVYLGGLVCIYLTLSTMARFDTMSTLRQSTAGSNSKFSFTWTTSDTRSKKAQPALLFSHSWM